MTAIDREAAASDDLPDRLAGLVAGLDLGTKVRLLTGAAAFTLQPQASIGLAEVRVSDGPTGVRGTSFPAGPAAALFPNATLLASSWSEDVAYEVGRLLAEEALAQRIHVVLGPTINLHRTPLGGRLFEAYSEDPLLSGRLAAAYVRGLQDQRVGACLKHLVANESETNRDTMNSVVDEATLRELYLLPFEIAVADADPWAVMAAYNDVNGLPATEQHHVNNEILKGEWSWAGVLMSDWYATKSVAPAALGGLDLVMPGPLGPWGQALVAAVAAGSVPAGVLDDHVTRVLRLADRVGALGSPRSYPSSLPAPGGPERRAQLTRLAAQGMTVLTNRSVLPLRRSATVALVGRHAVETIGMGGGSAQVNPPYLVSVAAGLTEQLGERVTVVDGVEVRRRAVAASAPYLRDPVTGSPGTHAVLCGPDGTVLGERHSDSALTTVGLEEVFADHVTSLRIRAVASLGGAVEIGVIGAGEWVVTHPGGAFDVALPPEGGSLARELIAPSAASRVVSLPAGGVVEAVVTLAHPAGTRADDLVDGGPPPALTGMGTFGLTVRPAPRPSGEVLAEAAAAASAADVAVVVVGLTEEQETETVDKVTLALPGDQDALVRAVAAAARATVVVVNAATPVLMPWLDEVDAVLWAGLPGQEAGRAVAAALLGDVEPAGRLVTTFPAADGASPAWSVTPVAGDLEYGEGTFIGYRGHFAGRAPSPAFWLGHGLGYGTWEYGSVELVGESPARVAVTVRNTGERESREVVQVYYDPPPASAADSDVAPADVAPADVAPADVAPVDVAPAQPVRLAGWAAVVVEPGASARVTVTCDPRMWRRWDVATGSWARLTGGRLLVARGLGDVRATIDLPPS